MLDYISANQIQVEEVHYREPSSGMDSVKLGQNIYPSSRVPAAPFEKNWHELAMKRMLRYAAENSYDRVAWTTGNQQAGRYSLGEHIDFVTAEPYEAMTPTEADGFDVTLHTRGMATVDLFVTKDGIVQSGSYGSKEDYFVGQPLSKVIDTALTEKVLAVQGWQRFDSDDLHVGAEGMNTFYDQMLNDFARKVNPVAKVERYLKEGCGGLKHLMIVKILTEFGGWFSAD